MLLGIFLNIALQQMVASARRLVGHGDYTYNIVFTLDESSQAFDCKVRCSEEHNF